MKRETIERFQKFGKTSAENYYSLAKDDEEDKNDILAEVQTPEFKNAHHEALASTFGLRKENHRNDNLALATAWHSEGIREHFWPFHSNGISRASGLKVPKPLDLLKTSYLDKEPEHDAETFIGYGHNHSYEAFVNRIKELHAEDRT